MLSCALARGALAWAGQLGNGKRPCRRVPGLAVDYYDALAPARGANTALCR